MRLIDADKLKEMYFELINDEEVNKVRKLECLQAIHNIDAQPTASTIQEIVTDDGYELGYADGQNEARKDLTFCKDCENWEYPVKIKGLNGDTSHIGMCTLTKWLCGEQGFCMYAREVE